MSLALAIINIENCTTSRLFENQKVCLYLLMQNHLKNELHNVLSGKSQIRFGTVIQTIASYLNDGEKTSETIEVEKHLKKETKNAKN